jgi:hypothetical protein
MAVPTLVATPKSPLANSYCTVAEGTTYHEAHLYATDWDAATTDQKTISLIMATRLLDSKYEWFGWMTLSTSEGQVLQWPRNSLVDIDKMSSLNSDTIPERIKWATAELASNLLVTNRTADSDVETQGISSLSAGPISLSFKDNVKAKVIPDYVRSLIPSWWGVLLGNQSTIPVARG